MKFKMEEEADDMHPAKSRGHKNNRVRSHVGSENQEPHDKRRKNQKTNNKPSFRRAYRGRDLTESKDPDDDQRKHDEKLQQELSESLVECSRQRLRALHMSFRQNGNDESKMSSKEMAQSFQENGMSIPSRTLKSLTSKFDSTKGIDLEGMYKFLTEAHAKTGRDSVLAMYKRNDLEQRPEVSQDEVDEDLLWRIEYQLIKSHEYIDVNSLRNEFKSRDKEGTGKLGFNLMMQTCNDQQLPVFGALLKNLLKRCDERKDGRVTWPEFLFFLSRAQENAWVSCPSLKELPEKQRNKTPVAPSPLDELSTRTRTTIVNKLRKKSSIKKPEAPDLTAGKTDENQNKTNTPAANDKKNLPESKAPETKKENNVRPTKTEEKSTRGNETSPSLSKKQTAVGGVPTATDEKEKTPVQPEVNPPSTAAQSEKESKGEDKTNADSPVDKLVMKVPIDIRIEQPSAENTPTKVGPGETGQHVTDVQVDQPDKGEERVTIKDGQIVSVKTEEEVIEERVEAAKPQNTSTLTVNIRGRTLTFTVPEGYLAQQSIDPPRERLRLNWLYGYRGNDCRKNMHVLASGELVYFMAHIVILYNRVAHKQRHYREHTEDIKCMDLHPDRLTVATGQYGSRKNANIKAHVRIWRSDTLQTLHVIGQGQFEKSVACIAFSPGKNLLAAVDNCMEKKLTVWDTTDGSLKGQEMLHTDLVCDVGFSSRYADTLFTVGKEHLCWWKVYPDGDTIQAASKPDFEGFLRAKFVICLACNDKGDVITGDSNGTIYVFGEGVTKITNYIKHAHDGPVFTVMFYKTFILSGGRDGILHCWHYRRNMDSAGFLQIPKTEGGIRMLTMSDNKLFVGTTMNSILVVTVTEGDMPLQGAFFDPIPLTQCHYDDLRGLTHVPGSHVDILTAGLDGIVCGYNSADRRSVTKFQMKGNQYICIDSNNVGSMLVLGTKDGHVIILQSSGNQWEEVVNRKVCKERLDCIRLSPDGRSVAVGSHDTLIYIFSNLPKDDGTMVWEYVGKLSGHTGHITGIDWSHACSSDGYLLRSSSSTLELKYWLPKTVQVYDKPVPASTKWATYTVLVDLSVAGILETKCASDTEAYAIDVNPAGFLVAMGDNAGGISLFRFPSSIKGVICHGYKSHAAVHNVKFTPCGKYVMTVGGKDSCLMQWEIV